MKDASNVGKDTLDQSTDADAYVVPPDDCPSPTFGSAAAAIAIGTFPGADVAASVVHSPDRLTTVDATASEHSQLSFAPAAAKGHRRLFLKEGYFHWSNMVLWMSIESVTVSPSTTTHQLRLPCTISARGALSCRVSRTRDYCAKNLIFRSTGEPIVLKNT